ncbi:MAG: hypothetical protein A3B38_03040 [Candidatus Levybacteria bacterium RIFCSPLOWO2_01_FULL_36_13]|nr:MAG: hypothetical protein A2684_04130 [Candidatus Levybacteria bacterium RIFCSPHIGHO2_01_FULL_36_15b]OGH35866.1 MAG: hypothetical protein A3B38_03040 [Candidatus Levybacteria bacterium RIFCSPLOWO2_01_FULL_36_13]
MLLSIVLINYKKYNLTISCLNSLITNFKKEFSENIFEVIIVDNASNDGSLKVLNSEVKDKKYNNVRIIENKKNDGFGKGCNIGVSCSSGKFLLFLNNDTVVNDRGILDMVTYIEQSPSVAILGGQLKNIDGSLQPSSGSFYTLAKAIMLLLGLQKYRLLDKSPDKISEVDWVKGGLLMIRKEIFNLLNGFDENMFMYIEDMELCYRAKKMGYKTFFFPDLNILHKEYGTTNRTFAIVNIYKNLLYFYKKHRSYLEFFILKTVLITKAIILILIGYIVGNSYLKNTYKEALSVIK